MKKRTFYFLIILFVLVNLSVILVSAAEKPWPEEILSIGEGVNIAKVYLENYYFVDFVMFLFLFLGVARVTLEKRFEGTGGRWLVRAMGIILAAGMSVWEYNSGFKIGDLGPLIAIVFIALVVIAIFNLLKWAGGGVVGAGAWAYLVVFFTAKAVFPQLWTWLQENAGPVIGILWVGAIFAIIFAIKGLFSMLTGAFTGGAVGASGGAAEQRAAAAEEKKFGNWISNKAKESKEKKEATKAAQINQKVQKFTGDMADIEDKLSKADRIAEEHSEEGLKEYENQKKLIDSISQLLTGSWTYAKNIGDITAHMRSNTLYYEGHVNEIQNAITKYGQFVKKLTELMERLRLSIQKQGLLAAYDRKLVKYFESLDLALKKRGQSIDEFIKKLGKKGEISEELKEQITKELNYLRREVNSLSEEGDDIQALVNLVKLDKEDEEILEKDVKFLGKYGLINKLFEAIRQGLTNQILLTESDVRGLWNDLKRVSAHTDQKIHLRRKLRGEEGEIERHLKLLRTVTERLRRMENMVQRYVETAATSSGNQIDFTPNRTRS